MKIDDVIAMDKKKCDKDHNMINEFIKETDTWYIKDDNELHDSRCMKCRCKIQSKKAGKISDIFIMGYTTSIYVYSGRVTGCRAFYCGECWSKELVGLRGVGARRTRRTTK